VAAVAVHLDVFALGAGADDVLKFGRCHGQGRGTAAGSNG
jgi:hypothetical protein